MDEAWDEPFDAPVKCLLKWYHLNENKHYLTKVHTVASISNKQKRRHGLEELLEKSDMYQIRFILRAVSDVYKGYYSIEEEQVEKIRKSDSASFLSEHLLLPETTQALFNKDKETLSNAVLECADVLKPVLTVFFQEWQSGSETEDV